MKMDFEPIDSRAEKIEKNTNSCLPKQQNMRHKCRNGTRFLYFANKTFLTTS